MERGICPIANSTMTDSVIVECACVKLLYFYFRSEIWRSERWRWSTCVIVSTFLAIGQTVTDIWRFSIFEDGGRHHLGFLNFWNVNDLNAQEGRTVSSPCWIFIFFNVNEGQTALSCRISWRSVKPLPTYGVFRFFFSRWRPPPSWILEIWSF